MKTDLFYLTSIISQNLNYGFKIVHLTLATCLARHEYGTRNCTNMSCTAHMIKVSVNVSLLDL